MGGGDRSQVKEGSRPRGRDGNRQHHHRPGDAGGREVERSTDGGVADRTADPRTATTIDAAVISTLRLHLAAGQRNGTIVDSVDVRGQAVVILASLRGIMCLRSRDPECKPSLVREELLASIRYWALASPIS